MQPAAALAAYKGAPAFVPEATKARRRVVAVTATCMGGSTNCTHWEMAFPCSAFCRFDTALGGCCGGLSPKAPTSWSSSELCLAAAASLVQQLVCSVVCGRCLQTVCAVWLGCGVSHSGCGFHGVGCSCVGYTVCFSCFLLLSGLAAAIVVLGVLGVCVAHVCLTAECVLRPASGWQHLAGPQVDACGLQVSWRGDASALFPALYQAASEFDPALPVMRDKLL